MIDKLEFLMVLAGEQHFGRSADLCRVTQSTFSSGIKDLEATFGVMLVQRGSRFVGLTPEGERVVNWARRIVGATRSLREEITSMRKGLAGELRIAAIPMALPIISSLTTPIRAKHPELRFSIYSRTAPEIAKMMETLSVDAAITYMDNPAFSRYLSQPLYDDEYHFVAEVNSPFARRESITWREVAAVPLCLLTRDTQSRQIIDDMLQTVGGTLQPTLESNAIMVLFDHIRTGKWASVLSSTFAKAIGLSDTIRAIPIVEPSIMHKIGVIIPQPEPMTPVNKALIAEARRLVKALN